jgi:high affinity Mn2+ porin
VAVAQNHLSSQAQAYFAAGGTGILIGDGALRYGPEKIFESYYSVEFATHRTVTADIQRVVNPAHNRDRGPVTIYGIRAHVEF